ncbi:zinc-ribbon domain-containing protein [Hansschlegelia plantiphila]|uniref:Thioredoxin n=1 Tax=Hansschlegelia plantiphila TaxID=374655 RepID=A0A9W6IWQ7_9HYPH|nr:zinc-ribbon domain-containing protein [Hansschlegelia plantiphila]GLK66437.1 thioredoxin [Hansschlegelia plantiphila]
MLVTCPSCRSSYRLDDRAISEGRTVRCARCATEWFAAATATPVMALDDVAPLDVVETPRIVDVTPSVVTKSARRAVFSFAARNEPVPARPTVRTPRKTSRVRPAAAFAIAGLAALALLVFERDTIVRATPSLASLYAAVGLDVNVRGLDIRDVRSSEQVEEGVPLLLVTGSIANLTQGQVDVPRLRLAVKSGDDRELYAWTTIANRLKLAPGGSAQFRARLASPPAEGEAVAVRFLGRRDIMTTNAGR